DVAATCGHDAGGHSAAKAERIANRHNPVADAWCLVCELHIGKVASAIDLDQRKVGSCIRADNLGTIGLTVICCDLDGLRLVHDVVVGHGISVGGDEEA